MADTEKLIKTPENYSSLVGDGGGVEEESGDGDGGFKEKRYVFVIGLMIVR